MEIIVGKLSGFCNGVKKAVEKTNELLDNDIDLYCLGELVHNENVINNLKNKGLKIVNSLDRVPVGKTVLFRAHGETLGNYELAKKRNITVVDLTCPRVNLIHDIIIEKRNDYFCLVIGKKNHPETIGIISNCLDDYYVIDNIDEIDKVIDLFKKSKKEKLFVVSQTTMSNILFDNIIFELKERLGSLVEYKKTICNITENRQKEVDKISSEVNKMIIIGGLNSSNTKELYLIAKNNCKNTYLIQSYMDLDHVRFEYNDKIGMMGGASTDIKDIDMVIDYLEKE